MHTFLVKVVNCSIYKRQRRLDMHHQMPAHKCAMCNQHKMYMNIIMAGINRTLLCLAKDAVGKELGEP